MSIYICIYVYNICIQTKRPIPAPIFSEKFEPRTGLVQYSGLEYLWTALYLFVSIRRKIGEKIGETLGETLGET